MKRRFGFWGKIMVVGVTLLLWGFPVCADDFTGSSSGIFVNPTGPSGMVTTGVNSNFFTWGEPLISGTNPNSLEFTGNNFSGFFETTEFKFGILNYFNGTIENGSQENTVNLETRLDFTVPTVFNKSFTFTFQLINTLNTGTPDENADSVMLNNAFDATQFFTIGVTDYTLQFTRFGNIGSGGFITTVDQFHVYEGETASADLFGKITAQPHGVFEPSSLFLLGAGLLGLAGLRRKNRVL
jgi:hypothetical protein